MTTTLDRITTTAARMEGGVKKYGFDDASIRALDEVDVGFEVRRFTATMGPSGSIV